jgi:chromosome condensin MukBEF complex kleisin-like MukF subunit
VAAERGGYERQDDCDKAAAEEMVCRTLRDKKSMGSQTSFTEDLRALLDRDDYIWSGVYNDTRFDRHVRTYIRKLIKMTKTNQGFGNRLRYQ